INTLRSLYSLGAFAWSTAVPTTGGAVLTAHLTDLRAALDAVYFKAKNTHLTFDSIQAGTTIKVSHLNELRTYVRGLE
ncbi:MAG TPA: hypothetical protein VE825_05185, partial [Terriglobales bacterium]|nr:hypothetical protein [Terriglobales bacterium]